MKRKSVYEQLTQLPYLSIYQKLICGAMELDVFSGLGRSVSADELATEKGWDTKNTEVLLDSLYAVGFVRKDRGKYVNTEEAERYLSSSSADYAAGFLKMYMHDEASSMNVAELVRKGSGSADRRQMDQSLDFTRYGEAFRAAQRGCRQQEILRIVRKLPENGRIRKILDIGCNTGLLGLSLIADDPERTGVLFDLPLLCPLIDESIVQEGMAGRAQSRGGDFLADDLGSGYDLILAVSVMTFAGKNKISFLKKLYDALASQGMVLCIGEGVKRDFSEPWDMIMGFLPYRFRGMDMAVRSGEIKEAAEKAGFTGIETRTERLCSGMQDIVILRK